jgi:hypothetical protein
MLGLGSGPVTRHGGLPGTYGGPNGAGPLAAPGATRP